MSLTNLKTQLTQALDSLDDAELKNVVEYVEFLKFRARHNPYHITDEIAALYGEYTDEDRTLADEGMASYHSSLAREDEI